MMPLLSLGPLTFLAPLALLGLIVLPLIWWLLRITPPKPLQQFFPPLRILRQVNPEEETPNSTPLWLLIFRLFLVALVAIALAQPLISKPEGVESNPVVLIVDNGWDAAPNWPKITKEAENRIADARRENVDVMLIASGEDQQTAEFVNPSDALRKLKSLSPKAVHSDRAGLSKLLKAETLAGSDIYFMSSGITQNLEDINALSAKLDSAKNKYVISPNSTNLPLIPGELSETADGFRTVWHRPDTNGLRSTDITAHGKDGRVIARNSISFSPGQSSAEAVIELPAELRSRITILRASDSAAAGSVKLLDDSWGRPLIGVLTEGQDSGSPLLSEPFYAETALRPYADVFRGSLDDLLPIAPSIIVMPDAARTESAEIKTFLENGGLLIRFAGPKLAKRSDAYIPVSLREGGRAMGGALTWEEPQNLASFTADSPFFGLSIPEDVEVNQQIMAEPGAETDSRTWARLEDGSPIVTTQEVGFGRIVLFHVTAGPEWSNLPVSGLYVDMLRRLLSLAKASNNLVADGATGDWAPERVLTGYGRLTGPDIFAKPIAFDAFETTEISRTYPPGLYRQGPRRKALNFDIDPVTFNSISDVKGISTSQYGQSEDKNLGGRLLALALLLLAIDGILAIWVSGRMNALKSRFKQLPKSGTAAAFIITATFLSVSDSPAQEGEYFEDALELRLAYVITNDVRTDRVSERAMAGLVDILNRRTTIEPVGVRAVDPGTDNLLYYPFLYWPVNRDAPALTDRAVSALNEFMASGGTIIFDTQDSGDSFSDVGYPHPGLQRVTERLDIPELQQVPENHVLNKSYYLIDIYPGRWANGPVWVDRNQNGAARDGVSSVIIGGNDWAEAWQQAEDGTPLGDLERDIPKQREMAMRFGINVAMYTLAGNYKADQVHAKELIERQRRRELAPRNLDDDEADE
ncbi:MAG: DUF4159 domain-containing protein [Hellea sp.]|nr:DUF4159 domain-containing protein [Hellea sp.]